MEAEALARRHMMFVHFTPTHPDICTSTLASLLPSPLSAAAIILVSHTAAWTGSREGRRYQAEVDARVEDRFAEEFSHRPLPHPPFPHAAPPPHGYPGFPMYAPIPGGGFDIDPAAVGGRPSLRYMHELAPRYARLQQLLAGLTPEQVVSQRDQAMRYVFHWAIVLRSLALTISFIHP